MIMQEHPSITCSINKSEFRKLIMAKGTASKSASGASMSKYDVEVEARLQKAEEYIQTLSQQVAELQEHVNDHQVPSVKLDKLTEVFKREWPGKFADV